MPARLPVLVATMLSGVMLAGSALAQSPFSEMEEGPLEGMHLPGLSQYAPTIREDFEAGNLRSITLNARLTADGGNVERGLVWRVFGASPGQDGKLPLIASAEGGSATFDFPPGDYFLHVSFGRASLSKKIVIPQSGPVPPETLTLDAGGLVLDARSGDDRRIPPEDLHFAIYTKPENGNGDGSLIVPDVKPGKVVRLNAGTYHIVSTYGTLNASVRSDIHISAGKLTEATIEHRAAELTLKLVSEEGGEAIADTAWSILTESGDPVAESVGAFPTVVLSEGEYTAVARNKDKVYQRPFTVEPGVNTDVEVLLGDDQVAAVHSE